MILDRGYIYMAMPVRHSGGSFGAYDRCAWATPERLARWHGASKQALPAGYGVGSAIVLPGEEGWLGATDYALGGAGQLPFANLAGGKGAEATLTVESDLGAAAQARGNVQAVVGGDGAIDLANLAGLVPAQASLLGSTDMEAAAQAIVPLQAEIGGLASADAGVKAAVGLFATILSGGEIQDAALAAGMWLEANLGGNAWLDTVVRGLGLVGAEIAIGASPTAFDIAQAILNAQAEMYDLPGTIGEKINDAGSAGNPWNEVIEAGLTAEEALRLLLAVLAGKSSGGGTSTIRFRDLGDTKDRVVATVDENGNRTDVSLDGA